MRLIRFIGRLGLLFLVPVILLSIIAFNLRLSLISSKPFLKSAENARVYDAISHNYDYIADNLGANQLPISKKEVARSLEKAFPKEFIKKETEAHIDGFFNFFNGK